MSQLIPRQYCPHLPTQTQRAFLGLNCLEAFFGGAAGGGKSEALLMAALQYVNNSGYAALIIRKDLQRLALAGGLIPRSHHWLAATDARWNGAKRQWLFPNPDGPPATLTFGYLAGPLDKYRYGSSEFHYIAFDELTELAEEDYLFLFSRLRRAKDTRPPLRVRAASNPGGPGHLWVKRRFISEESLFPSAASPPLPLSLSPPLPLSPSPPLALNPEPRTLNPPHWLHGRAYIPSRLIDNPYLDPEEYRQSLLHLPPLIRERLMNGDWTVQEEGLIQAAWLRYFVEDRDQLELLDPHGRSLAVVPDGSCRRFVTVDPAGTSAERTREARGRAPSWTVAQVWDQPRRELARFLLLRHQVRMRVGFEGLCRIICNVAGEWQPERIWIEDEKLGRAACETLERDLPIGLIPTAGQDKVARAARLTLKLERGEIFLPRHDTTWRPAWEAELLAWTGDDRQPSDQIDAAAYAAIIAANNPVCPIRITPIVTTALRYLT
jgi:phage terminase large subunit-like protein